MDGDVLPSKLLTRLSKAADIVRGHDSVHVFTHYDADGLSSAGILANTLLRAKKQFIITTFTTLDADNMQIIRECDSDCMIIADLGASYIKEIEELGKDVVVLDHHTLREDSESIAYANPHLFGVDGMVGACGATMSFLFSVTYDEKNWDLVQIAFAGIAGDKQHLNGLTGFNTYLLKEGEKRGFIKKIGGSLIPSGILSETLMMNPEPYIRGITGNKDSVLKLLSDANISPDSQYVVLDDDERRRLSSMISVRLASQGVTTAAMSEIMRDRYHLKDWGMDAESLAELLDACGRMMLQGVGVALCMGGRDDLLKAKELRDEYNKSIMNALLALDSKGLTLMNNIQCLDSSETGFTGVLCGVAMRFFADPEKPTIGMNSSEDRVKISARGTNHLLDIGVDLADALNRSCAAVGGEGGGHRIASGGTINKGSEEEFLKVLDDIIGEQIMNARSHRPHRS